MTAPIVEFLPPGYRRDGTVKRSDIAEVFGVPTPIAGPEASRDAAVTADQAEFLNARVSDKPASDHVWDVRMLDAHAAWDGTGFVMQRPPGYAEFRCSCGVVEQVIFEEVAAKASEHLGFDVLERASECRSEGHDFAVVTSVTIADLSGEPLGIQCRHCGKSWKVTS